MDGQQCSNGSPKAPMAPECFIETCDICQSLADLEEQIDSSSNFPQDIQQKLVTLKTLRNASHDRLGIKIPVEIINQIFVFVDRTNNSCPTSPGSPLPAGYICYAGILSSVCRRWRDITLAQPELWTNIYINLLKQSDRVEIAKEWLNRSGTLPLDLTLYSPRDKKSEDRSAMVSMINLLRLHSVRWEYIDLQYAPPDAVYLLFNNLERMPTSEFINLRIKDYFHDIIVFPTPLQPRRLCSSLFQLDKIVSLGWENLTYLQVAYSRELLLLEIIGQAPNLKQCVLEHPHSLPNDVAFPPVTSLSLERLECTVSSPRLFRHITLPSLRHLKYDVRAGRSRSNAQMDALIDFLARSALDFGSLDVFDLEFHFYADFPPEYDAIRLFELNTLTRLSFEVWGPPELDVRPVLIKLFDNTVFPQLQELRIVLTGEAALEPSSWSFLCDMVTGHNFRANTMNIDDTQRSLKPSSGTSTDQIPFDQQGTPTLIPSVDIQHGHSLKSIAIHLIDRWGAKFRVKIRMKKQVLFRLQEAQKVGPLNLEISNGFRDVLQSLQHDGPGEDDVADLQLLPVSGTNPNY